MQKYQNPAHKVGGELSFDGDKSISHRLVLISALLKYEICLSNLSRCEDVKTSLKAVQKLGVKVREIGEFTYLDGSEVKARSTDGEPLELYCGNSGTTARLLCGILACIKGCYVLTGDESLSKRPMERVALPLRRMGVDITCGRNGCFPVLIKSTGKTKSIIFENITNSAQVRSAVELASLALSEGEEPARIIEANPGRDHTARLLKHINFKQPIVKSLTIPGDPSSAAYFAAAAAMFNNSAVRLKNILLNKTRIGFYEVLQNMGAEVDIISKLSTYEPVGDIIVKGKMLRAIKITGDLIPAMIDEVVLSGVIMSFAEGISEVTGARELRIKESDRITGLINGLKKLNINCEEKEDGFIIKGLNILNSRLKSNDKMPLECFSDHRLCMSFSILALKTSNGLIIGDSKCVKISFPGFFEKLQNFILE